LAKKQIRLGVENGFVKNRLLAKIFRLRLNGKKYSEKKKEGLPITLA